jgi:hypothetical protein
VGFHHQEDWGQREGSLVRDLFQGAILLEVVKRADSLEKEEKGKGKAESPGPG